MILSAGALAVLLVLACAGAADADIYVDEGGWWRAGGAFNASGAPIQAAVDAGNAIYVWNGSYSENVDVGTAHLTPKAEVGVDAADEVNVTFEGHFGGITYAVAVSGNYAYIGQGQDFVVLSISNPAAPSESSRLSTAGVVRDITVSGNYAYVVDWYNGLVIVDISNKTAPTLVAQVSHPKIKIAIV